MSRSRTKRRSICELSRLVIDQIKTLEPERKCFRMVGGVLVERNVGEALKALEHRADAEVS